MRLGNGPLSWIDQVQAYPETHEVDLHMMNPPICVNSLSYPQRISSKCMCGLVLATISLISAKARIHVIEVQPSLEAVGQLPHRPSGGGGARHA